MTQEKIQVTVTAEGVEQQDPSNAAVTIVIPKTSEEGAGSVAEIWMMFCGNVHFFSSSEVASKWVTGKNLDVTISSVEDAYQLGRLAFEEVLQFA